MRRGGRAEGRDDGQPRDDQGPEGLGPNGDDLDEDVRGVVRAAVDAVGRAGTVSASGVTEAVESAGRRLVRRVVVTASTSSTALADHRALARALGDRPQVPAFGSGASAAMALRFMGRFRRLGFLARRTPAYLFVLAVPALVTSVSRGADELGMVTTHLVQRARASGVEPDLERVRRVAVQVMARRPIDPEVEPSHGALVVQWLRRAFKAAMPFMSGVATADPEGLASVAADLDPELLGPA